MFAEHEKTDTKLTITLVIFGLHSIKVNSRKFLNGYLNIIKIIINSRNLINLGKGNKVEINRNSLDFYKKVSS